MWDKVSRADLEEAKQRLNVRREETLRRHIEELRGVGRRVCRRRRTRATDRRGFR